MAKITIYSKNGCPQCVGAKMAMASKGVEYEEKNISLSEEFREEALSYNLMGLPIIVAEGTTVEPFAGFNTTKLMQAIAEIKEQA